MEFLWLLLGLVIGAVAGFYFARRYMMNYVQENPPIDEDMLRLMMTQMGQRPSEAKVRQIAASMRAQAKKKAKTKK